MMGLSGMLCHSSEEETSGINKSRTSSAYIIYTNDSQSQVKEPPGNISGASRNRSNCHASLSFCFL